MNLLAPLAWLPLLVVGVVIAKQLTKSWSRALGGARLAAPILLAVWILVRLFDFLAKGGGPLKWVAVSTANTATAAPFADATLRLSVGAGLVLAGATIAVAKLRKQAPAKVTFGVIAAALAGLCGLLVAGTFAAGPLPFATALPVDLAAVIPALAGAIALGLAAPAEHAALALAAKVTPVAVLMPRREVTPPQTEAEARLKKAGLLGAPAFTAQVKGSVELPTGADEIDRVWDACGGAGPAPSALRKGLDAAANTGILIADLPVPTEEALVDAAALITMFEARRVLVIAEDARATRDRIVGRAAPLGGWRAGITVAGEGELATAAASGQCPALIVLSARDLGGKALGVHAPDGSSWVELVDRVILVGTDQLAPILSTHAAFALRRLRLALDRTRARPAWLATGAAGPETATYLELATLARFELIGLGAAWTARTTVHIRAGGDSTGELTTAAQAIGNLPAVAIEDALAELRTGGARVTQAPGWRGAVALARLEDRQLAGLYRARTQLAHRLPGNAYSGLWWIDDTPLSRFLLRDGVLAGLAQQGELPAARPVVGLGNQFLAAAHLEAALAEGTPDEDALRWAFGDAAVDGLVSGRPEIRTGARRARWDGDAHAVVATPVLSLGANAWSDPRRDTVTANAIEVKSSVDGSVVARVDRRTAPTRMYPHRVFRSRGALWQVPAATSTTSGASITASPAPAGETPSAPELEVELAAAEWIARPEQHTSGKLKFARAVAKVSVKERVTGAIARGAAAAGVRYAPVSAEYGTVGLVVLFEKVPSRKALRHAGRLAADLVPAHVRVERDDLELVVAHDGLAGVARPALVFIDRHPDGIGLADALDPNTVHDLLRWTWGVLYRCPCVDGCAGCTPADVLAAGPDKVGALKLLGG